MTKYLIAAVAALTLALGASGWFHLKQAEAAGELGQQLTVAQADAKQARAAARRADAAIRQARQEHAKEEAAAKAVSRAVEAALLSEPTWGSTPVPKAILEAIDAPTDPDSLAGLERLLDGLNSTEPAPVSPPGAVPDSAPGDSDERGPAGVGPRSSAFPEEVQH